MACLLRFKGPPEITLQVMSSSHGINISCHTSHHASTLVPNAAQLVVTTKTICTSFYPLLSWVFTALLVSAVRGCSKRFRHVTIRIIWVSRRAESKKWWKGVKEESENRGKYRTTIWKGMNQIGSVRWRKKTRVLGHVGKERKSIGLSSLLQ